MQAAVHVDCPALAVCDRDGVYGTARVHGAAKKAGVRPIVGVELTLDDNSVIPVLVRNRQGYQNLCRLITQAKLGGTKHEAPVAWRELAEFSEGLVVLTGDEEGPVRRPLAQGDKEGALSATHSLMEAFGEENVFIEIQRHHRRGEERANRALRDLAGACGLPSLATNGVQYAIAAQTDRACLHLCANLTHLDLAGRLREENSERLQARLRAANSRWSLASAGRL